MKFFDLITYETASGGVCHQLSTISFPSTSVIVSAFLFTYKTKFINKKTIFLNIIKKIVVVKNDIVYYNLRKECAQQARASTI